MVSIPAGFVQVTMNYTGPTNSGEAATVLGFTDGGGVDLAVISQEMNTAWGTDVMPLMHDSFTFTGSRVINASAEGVASYGGVNGNRTGALAPPNTTCLVRKQSNLRGRENRGRMYLPGMLLDGDIFDDGTIDISIVAAITTAVQTFLTNVAAANGYGQVILHSGASAPTIVDSISTENRVATQRRRLR